ncbi:hypothetical protein ATANTOWER_014384 [Ataeniobius toweri]|uniref:Uncharacterized protein n=1 Tax=Ataeniobius toweri TaxID=208326 RepID=A0ABU7AIT5_9TELE|nr:hypothetical protein [Ataeniobius toweri]
MDSRLVVFRFILNRVAGAADSVETPRRPSPQTPPPAPPGGAQGVPRPAKRHSPSSVSWAVPWASSRWDVLEEAHFSRLYPGSRSFSHDPKFMTIASTELELSRFRFIKHFPGLAPDW